VTGPGQTAGGGIVLPGLGAGAASGLGLKSLQMAIHVAETDEKRDAVAAAADIVGAKWTALLIYDLAGGRRRFRDLEHSCAGISSRTLAERLRALEREGVVRRHSYPESPPRVEYDLTEKGRALLPIVDAMTAFGRSWLIPDKPLARAS
jgi:DNA-binding HxlR family transcriptional regulator